MSFVTLERSYIHTFGKYLESKRASFQAPPVFINSKRRENEKRRGGTQRKDCEMNTKEKGWRRGWEGGRPALKPFFKDELTVEEDILFAMASVHSRTSLATRTWRSPRFRRSPDRQNDVTPSQDEPRETKGWTGRRAHLRVELRCFVGGTKIYPSSLVPGPGKRWTVFKLLIVPEY